MSDNNEKSLSACPGILAISNPELKALPELKGFVRCWVCGKRHRVRYGHRRLNDGTLEPSDTLAFMKCGGKSYLCGIKGKEWRP